MDFNNSNEAKELKKDTDLNDDIRDKIRLYLDIDSQILKHSEYWVRIQKETAKEGVVIKKCLTRQAHPD